MRIQLRKCVFIEHRDYRIHEITIELLDKLERCMHIAWPFFKSIILELFTYLPCDDETDVDQLSIE